MNDQNTPKTFAGGSEEDRPLGIARYQTSFGALLETSSNWERGSHAS